MDEKSLERLLRQAAQLPDDEARQRWLDGLSAEAREAVLARARAYAEAAFAAASEHLWVAQEIFDPMSHGEAPEKPLPKVNLPHPSKREAENQDETAD